MSEYRFEKKVESPQDTLLYNRILTFEDIENSKINT